MAIEQYQQHPGLDGVVTPRTGLYRGLACAFLFGEGAGTQTRDYSPYGMHITSMVNMDDTNWEAGWDGWDLKFNGNIQAEYCEIAYSSHWADWESSNRTMAAWVRVDGAGGGSQRIEGHTLFAKPSGNPNGFMWGIHHATNKLTYRTGSINVPSTNVLGANGTWNHVCTTTNVDDDEIIHYVNGKKSIHAFSSWGADNLQDLVIGAHATYDYSNCALSSIFGWFRQLTDEDVREHMAQTYMNFVPYNETYDLFSIGAAAGGGGDSAVLERRRRRVFYR